MNCTKPVIFLSHIYLFSSPCQLQLAEYIFIDPLFELAVQLDFPNKILALDNISPALPVSECSLKLLLLRNISIAVLVKGENCTQCLMFIQCSERRRFACTASFSWHAFTFVIVLKLSRLLDFTHFWLFFIRLKNQDVHEDWPHKEQWKRNHPQ